MYSPLMITSLVLFEICINAINLIFYSSYSYFHDLLKNSINPNAKTTIATGHTASSTNWIFVLVLCLEAELLSANGRLVHQAAFGMDKHGHAFIIACFCLYSGSRAGVGAGCSTFSTGLGLNTGCYGYSGCRRVKLKISAGKFIISTFIFEKNYLAECLPA